MLRTNCSGFVTNNGAKQNGVSSTLPQSTPRERHDTRAVITGSAVHVRDGYATRRSAARRLRLGADWKDLDLVCDSGDGRPIDPDAFGRAFKRLAVAAGLPRGARLHDLRHAFAVLLRLEDVPVVAVSATLGHSSASFTISQYEHVVHQMQKATVEALERRLGG